MNFNNFTIKSQEAVQQAVNLVQSRGQQAIEPEHLLAGVLKVGENVTNFIFQKLGINGQQIETVLDKQIASLPKVSGGEPYLSRDANEVLQKAVEFSKSLGDEYVSLEAIILALLNVKSTVSTILKDAGVTDKELRAAISELRQGQNVTSQSSEDTYQSLSKYAINLIEAARNGKLDPVIGRDEEIRRVLQILSRRTKNNPVLIGEPGTGKTAIVEGLAHRILRGDVPENLKNKQVYSLDMGALVAGAKYKGEFEERLKSVVNEVLASEGEIILFIDEIHRLSPVVEEYLYSAMEDFRIDIMIDKGPSARSIQIELNPFTLVGATTRSGLLTSPLRARFGINCHLEYYDHAVLTHIIERSAKLLCVPCTHEAATEIAMRSRGTPRIGNALLRRVRDFAQVKGSGSIDLEIARYSLEALNIDKYGLDEIDNKILSVIIDKFKGGPVGLTTIATALGEDPGTLEEVYEPYLIKEGFIKRTPRGREVTDLAYTHLNRRRISEQGTLF